MLRTDDDEHAQQLTHGQLCYLQIPAADAARAATFYASVFGWHTEPPDTGFSAPGLIGQWITDRPPAHDAGPLAWIAVDSIDASLATIRAYGGAVVEPPTQDGPRLLAMIRDTEGNLLGIAQHGSG